MDLSAAPVHQLNHYNLQLRQEMGSQSDSQSSLDGGVITSSNRGHNQQQQDHKKPRPHDTEPPKCPRCESTNTKFCYYNNYSLTQPRYFCKGCRRYWTKGGTLRNVPVGGGCRKNRRASSSSSSSPSSFVKRTPHSQDMAPATVTPPALFPNLQLPADFSYAGLGIGFDDVMGGANYITGCESFVAHPHGGSLLDQLGIFPINESHGFGIGNGNDNAGGGGSSNSVSGISEEMALKPYEDVASTTGGGSTACSTTTAVPFAAAVKQEISNINSRAVPVPAPAPAWGYPWPNNGDYYGSMINAAGADLEPIRESWNGPNGNFVWPWLIGSPAL